MLVHAGRKLFVLLLLLFWGAAPAFAVDFNANWEHRLSGGEDRETQELFQQRYGLGAGPGLSFQPTPAISANANLGYTRSESNVGTQTVTTEEITPSATLNVMNDIFRTSLIGANSESRRTLESDRTRNSWDAVLSSNWERLLWPNLRLSYGESSERTDDLEALGALDAKDSRYAFGLDWDLLVAKFFYDYNSTQSESFLEQSQSETESHFARVETGGNFWNKRVNLRLSQQYEQSTSQGFLDISLIGGETLSQVVDANAAVPAEEVVLIVNPSLSDGDFDTEAVRVEFEQQAHLGVILGFAQQADVLHVHLDADTNNQLGPDQVNQLQWDLYRDNPFFDPANPGIELPWIPVSVGLSALHNPVESRFELSLSLPPDTRSFKVVVTNPLNGFTLVFTELSFPGDATPARQVVHLTNASMRVKLTPTLSASSSLIMEKAERERDVLSSDLLRRTLNGSLSWTPTPYIMPTIRYSETLQEESEVPDALSRTYSLMVMTIPLPSLNVTLGATRSERFTDDLVTTYSDIYSLTSTAKIYPDLTATVNASYLTSNRLQDDDTYATTNSLGTRIGLNARITRALTADLTTNYTQTQSVTSETDNINSTLILTYRPSDLLSMRVIGTKNWTDTLSSDTLTYNLNLSLLRTRITRVTFRYNRTQAEETRDSFGLDGSWDISRRLALQNRLNYTLAEVDSWSILTSLVLRM
jgi:hypothetical protein